MRASGFWGSLCHFGTLRQGRSSAETPDVWGPATPPVEAVQRFHRFQGRARLLRGRAASARKAERLIGAQMSSVLEGGKGDHGSATLGDCTYAAHRQNSEP